MAEFSDSDPADRPVGILAGNGKFPAEVARTVVARGGRVVIVGIDGEAGANLADFEVVRAGWGEVGRILATFKNARCREIVVVGGVTRPDLARLRPDLGAILNLPRLIGIVASGGDDGVLSALVRFIESKGLKVVSPAEIAPDLLARAGCLGMEAPSTEEMAGMLLGSNLVKALGPFDIGQAVIVSGGRIEGIEAAEGTDRMIERVAAARKAHAITGRLGVLVKRPKPAQELRVDLPAIGPETVTKAAQAGLAGIAVLAGQTLVADRAEVVRRAHEAGLFVYGFTDGDEAAPRSGGESWRTAPVETWGHRRAGARDIADARFGAAALARIAGSNEGGAVVVRGEHVLGIEPGSDVEALVARVMVLVPWGGWRIGSRAGVLVLGQGLEREAIGYAQSRQFHAIALTGPPQGAARDEIVRAADAAGVALIQVRG